jgi:predicted lipoprotein with Yx(FWY)xxD motif
VVTVTVADSDVGQILVDGEGRALYRFLSDSAGTSTCFDDCEANWPILSADGQPQAGEGLDGATLGTIEREDGSTQVTINGWPLYYFAGDQAPGDTNGQGVGDVWYLVAPDGSTITG